MNGLTAKNGVMVLKHLNKAGKQLAFRGTGLGFNKQYKIISNPYQKTETPVEGDKLSLIAR